MGSLIMGEGVKIQPSTAFTDGGKVRVLIIIVVLVLLSIYLSEKNEENMIRVLRACFVSVMFPVIPLYIAMVLLYWRKARTFSISEPQHWLGVLFVLVFSLVFQDWSETLGETMAAKKIFFDGLAIVVAFVLFQQLQLHRSEVEDEIKIASSRLPVAPGLALPFFQVIQGIVEGKSHSDSERREMSYEEGRARYSMEHRLDEGHWISEKIVILFLESDLLSKDIRKLERVRGETHVTRENLTLSCGNNIQARQSVLNVVKIRSYPGSVGPPSVQSDFTRSPGRDRHESDWVNNYVVIAENRPLKTLLEMKNNPQIEFTDADYKLQYKLYYEELKRLMDSSECTRDKVELFHYSENSIINGGAPLGKFSNHLKQIVEKLKGGRPSMPSRLKIAVDEVVLTMKAQDDVLM